MIRAVLMSVPTKQMGLAFDTFIEGRMFMFKVEKWTESTHISVQSLVPPYSP